MLLLLLCSCCFLEVWWHGGKVAWLLGSLVPWSLVCYEAMLLCCYVAVALWMCVGKYGYVAKWVDVWWHGGVAKLGYVALWMCCYVVM